MQKWEYFYFQTEWHGYTDSYYYTGASRGQVIFNPEDKANIDDVYSYLDRLGSEGWEMLAVNDIPDGDITRYHFKRPLN